MTESRFRLLPAAVCSAVLLMSAAVGRAGLVVTEVMSSSAHPGGPANGDWWELTNTGAAAISLNGYSFDDDSVTPGAALLPNGVSIAVGESILFVDESVANLTGWRAAWGISPSVQAYSSAQFTGVYSGLSAGGDQVNVYDNLNQLVASAIFAAASAGFSFEWKKNGDALGFSVIGENGAYLALSNGAAGLGVDVGSPGHAVPEPSSLALALLGAVGLGLVRRRKSRSAFRAN